MILGPIVPFLNSLTILLVMIARTETLDNMEQVVEPTTCGQSGVPLVSSLPADDPIFQEIVKEFVEDLGGKVQEMQQAWKVQDFVELRKLEQASCVTNAGPNGAYRQV